MIYLVFFLFVIALLYAPHLWVRYVLAKYAKNLDSIPGTGGELAQHLIQRFELDGVSVEAAEEGSDHYDPEKKHVCLSPSILNGSSLTAVAVATHEVGHAIQWCRHEKIALLRERYQPLAGKMEKIGIMLLMLLPIILPLVPIPHVVGIVVVIGLLTLFSSVLVYLIILPNEWDASFYKALPILVDGNYISEDQIQPVTQILKACAFTYVAAALVSCLRVWRWLAILRSVRW